jgi:hypothetical protein
MFVARGERGHIGDMNKFADPISFSLFGELNAYYLFLNLFK